MVGPIVLGLHTTGARADLRLARQLRTIPHHSIPRLFCVSRTVERHSILRFNLAVVRTVWPVVDVAATNMSYAKRKGWKLIQFGIFTIASKSPTFRQEFCLIG